MSWTSSWKPDIHHETWASVSPLAGLGLLMQADGWQSSDPALFNLHDYLLPPLPRPAPRGSELIFRGTTVLGRCTGMGLGIVRCWVLYFSIPFSGWRIPCGHRNVGLFLLGINQCRRVVLSAQRRCNPPWLSPAECPDKGTGGRSREPRRVLRRHISIAALLPL